MQTLIKKHIPKSAPCDHPWDTSSLIVFVVFLEGFLLLGGLLSTNMLIQIACFFFVSLYNSELFISNPSGKL